MERESREHLNLLCDISGLVTFFAGGDNIETILNEFRTARWAMCLILAEGNGCLNEGQGIGRSAVLIIIRFRVAFHFFGILLTTRSGFGLFGLTAFLFGATFLLVLL